MLRDKTKITWKAVSIKYLSDVYQLCKQVFFLHVCNSRSHAIFTITLEQMSKLPPVNCDEINLRGDMDGDYLCAKLHLVDLAGSERAKRTGSDGLRMLEGTSLSLRMEFQIALLCFEHKNNHISFTFFFIFWFMFNNEQAFISIKGY